MKEQIEEMAKVIEETDRKKMDSHCDLPTVQEYATDLYNAGYRKQSEEGAECPTCHGTGRIGTTDWLTKNMTKKQIAEEKAQAIAEHEQHIKSEVAREIFEEIEKWSEPTVFGNSIVHLCRIEELKKKYTEKKS